MNDQKTNVARRIKEKSIDKQIFYKKINGQIISACKINELVMLEGKRGESRESINRIDTSESID